MKSDMYDEAAILKELEQRTSDKVRVAFFCPQKGLVGNFGSIPEELERMGCEIVWLLGNRQYFKEFDSDNKYLIVNDMMKKVKGIDIVVTASVMDCLPNQCYKVIHDHLSFAHFDMEYLFDQISEGNHSDKFSSLGDVFENLSAFLVFLPFYDLILTSSSSVTDISTKALQIMGYKSSENSACFELNKDIIKQYVNVDDYRDTIKLVESGYTKLDYPINEYKLEEPENLIVYAPTPNDISGNKESIIWQSAMTVNDHGPDLVEFLCQYYKNYRIVFKPYKNELEHVVERYAKLLIKYDNFEISQVGSDYWSLYKKAKILISDFSSTAYTFSLGVGRPVVFYSPNENKLPADIRSKSYCKKRVEIGEIGQSLDDVVEKINSILNNYEQCLEKAEKFRESNIKNPGNSSSVAASAILNGYYENNIPEEKIYHREVR